MNIQIIIFPIFCNCIGSNLLWSPAIVEYTATPPANARGLTCVLETEAYYLYRHIMEDSYDATQQQQ